MRNGFLGLILAGGMTVLAFAPLLSAQRAQGGQQQRAAAPAEVKPAPRLPDGKPDLSGMWGWEPARRGRGGFGLVKLMGDDPPPMRPWAQERFNAYGEVRTEASNEVDPTIFCIPYGPGRAWATDRRPIEIVQTPSRVYIHFEVNHDLRRIYLDGRKMPDGFPPSYMGYSTGRWDGDTLVVETGGFNDLTWIDDRGHPHSEALRMEERFRRLNHDTLDIDIRYDDPEAYTRPWTGKVILKWKPDWEIVEHHLCEDHLLEVHLPQMRVRTIGPH